MFVLSGSEWVADRNITCIGSPAETRHWIKVGLTLGQRRRWWTNVEPTLIQRPLCQLSADHTGKHAYRWTITCRQRCFNAGTPSTTLAHHLVSVAVLGLLLMTGALPANTRRWPNVVLMSGWRRRRRAIIQTTLDHRRSRVVYSTEGQSVLLRSRVTRDVT